jgi:hypothetical protein
MKLLALALAALIFSPAAYAGRSFTLYPTDSPGGWSDGGGHAPCWSGGNRTLDFQNMSTTAQHIHIKVDGIVAQFGSCDGASPSPPYGGNWIQSSLSPGCWDTPAITDAPAYEVDIVLGPNDFQSVGVGYLCHTMRGGVNGCSFAPALSAPGALVPDLNSMTMGTFKMRIAVSVAEDRGAILANVVAQPISLCVDFKSTTRYNIPLNGGRPF